MSKSIAPANLYVVRGRSDGRRSSHFIHTASSRKVRERFAGRDFAGSFATTATGSDDRYASLPGPASGCHVARHRLGYTTAIRNCYYRRPGVIYVIDDAAIAHIV